MVIILTPMVLMDKKFADHQLVMPTPSERGAFNEINAKYEHEPMLSSWPARVAPVAPSPKHMSAPSADLHLPAMTVYARMVQERISKAIVYPNIVGKEGMAMAGTVKLELHILKNGSLDSAKVIESSANYILDQNAMQAAKIAAPYDAFATGMDQEGIIFTIPIVYNNPIAVGAQARDEKVIVSY
jgi:TonB family protein